MDWRGRAWTRLLGELVTRASWLCGALVVPMACGAAPPVVERAHAEISALHDNEALIRELGAMGTLDVALRERFLALRKTATPAERAALDLEWDKEYAPYDARSTEELRRLLQGRAWFRRSEVGSRAASYAFLVVQHSGDVAFQKAVLDKMTPLLGSDELDGQSYALLYDRIAVHDGRPQRYATQDAACQNGHHAVPRNIEDAGNLDRRRAEMGMGPIADYLRGLDEVYGACS